MFAFMNKPISSSHFSLTVDSELLLFTVQNTTQGLTVSIDQILPNDHHYTPRGITFKDVFIPPECNVAPCNAHFVNKKRFINETVFEFVLGVPAINSMLLLQFLYNLKSRQFSLTRDVVIKNGLVNNQYSPTATGYVAEDYMTLCINLVNKTGNILFLDLSSETFNSAIDIQFKNISFPIEDISFLDYPFSERGINNIFFPIGRKKLAMVDPGNYEAYAWLVPDCDGTIHKLKLRNDTNIDTAIPYLIYCDTNYVLVDFVYFDTPYFVSSHFYYETGYPLVCRNEKDSIVAEVTVFKNYFNVTINYDGSNTSIPGLDIDLRKSSCFGLKTKLFYLYFDAKEGVVLFDLVARNWSVLECQYQCNFKLFANRYILLEEVYNVNNVSLRLFDSLTLKFVSKLITNNTSDISYLLSLPSLPRKLDLQTILLVSIGGSVLLIIVTLVITVVIIGGII